MKTIMHLRYKDLQSYPLSDFTSEMIRIRDTDSTHLMQVLSSGDGLVTTKIVGPSNGLCYGFYRKGSILYAFNMKDTTERAVVLSLAAAATFTDENCNQMIVPVIRDYDNVFRIPERLIADAEKIICMNPEEDSHTWIRITNDVEKQLEDALKKDPATIFYMEVEPMAK